MIKRTALIIALMTGVLLIAHEFELHLPELETWVEGWGVYAPLAYIASFVILSPVFVSTDALCFAAGLLFSIGKGEIYVIIATYLAASVIFFIGRHGLKAKITALVARHQKFAALESLVSENPLKIMLLMRLTPLPFALLSYAFSVTRVRFKPYLLSTSGILIYHVSLVYFGYTTKHVAGLLSKTPHPSQVSYALLIAVFLGLVVLLIVVARMAARVLNPTSPDDNGSDL